MWRQPKAVWAVAFASVVAFMGIGLVDPILKPIADTLNASPSQVALLFTSYMAVMGVAMPITGVVSSRIGPKRILLLGLVVIIAGAGLAGMSDSVMGIVGWRALWGLGNALFIATALATIVSSARGSVTQAIILYEAALGLGIAVGPLVGGVLGSISWRGPFFGVSALMAVALVVTAFLLPATLRVEHTTSLLDPFRALRHRGLLGVGITALLYNFGFVTVLAFTPFPLAMSAHQLGLIFFGWGLALAFASVAVAPRLQHRFGTVRLIVNLLALSLAAGRDGDRNRRQGRPGRLRRDRRGVHRGQQHPDHRDRDEGCTRRKGRCHRGVQLSAIQRRCGRALAGRRAGGHPWLSDPHRRPRRPTRRTDRPGHRGDLRQRQQRASNVFATKKLTDTSPAS
jgi:MFS family permease